MRDFVLPCEDWEDVEFLKQWKEGLAATNADEINQFRRRQTLSRTRGHGQEVCDNYENLGLREGKNDQSLRLGRMIRTQDTVNIISEIWGNQNTHNREDNNHNQCHFRTLRHGAR